MLKPKQVASIKRKGEKRRAAMTAKRDLDAWLEQLRFEAELRGWLLT